VADQDGGGIEVDLASGIAELAHGHEGMGPEVWDYIWGPKNSTNRKIPNTEIIKFHTNIF
jgi:hypothetical protein